jgi:hypothetical protein
MTFVMLDTVVAMWARVVGVGVDFVSSRRCCVSFGGPINLLPVMALMV